MEKNWKLMLKTLHSFEAELTKNACENEGVTAVVLKKQDSMYHIGHWEVYVPNEDADAVEFIFKNQAV